MTSAAYHERVQALRQELADMQAEKDAELLHDLADIINTASWEYIDGAKPSRRDLGMVRGATLAGINAAVDAGWTIRPPEPWREL